MPFWEPIINYSCTWQTVKVFKNYDKIWWTAKLLLLQYVLIIILNYKIIVKTIQELLKWYFTAKHDYSIRVIIIMMQPTSLMMYWLFYLSIWEIWISMFVSFLITQQSSLQIRIWFDLLFKLWRSAKSF